MKRTEYFNYLRSQDHKEFQRLLAGYIRNQILKSDFHKHMFKTQGWTQLTEEETKQIFAKVSERFGMLYSESERQIRGLIYSGYKVDFDGNFGLFNLSISR